MFEETTLVLGASPNEERYANKAVRKLREHGHPVVAVGRRAGMIGDVVIQPSIPQDVIIYTVTIYLNAENQREWERPVLDLAPDRIIFNPGAENPDFAQRAREEGGIDVIEACTLVMLATGQY